MQPDTNPRDQWKDWFPATITGVTATNGVLVYSWSELTRDAGDTLMPAFPGRSGDSYDCPALEINNRTVEIGTTQFLRARGSSRGLIYEFDAGVTQAGQGHGGVHLAADGPLGGTYANGTAGVGATFSGTGTLGMDGYPCILGKRYLVWLQSAQWTNGVYVLTQESPWILTRTDDFDAPGDFTGASVAVADGLRWKNRFFVCDATHDVVIGTDPIVWNQGVGATQWRLRGNDVGIRDTPNFINTTTVTFNMVDDPVTNGVIISADAVVSGGSGMGSSLTVQEVDGNPSIPATTLLAFDQGDGFVLVPTGPHAGKVKLTPGGGTSPNPPWASFNFDVVTRICPVYSDFDGGTYTAENKSGTGFSPGAPVASHTSGVGVVLASAADNLRNAVGLATTGAGNGYAETIQTNGTIKLPDWTGSTGSSTLSPNAMYFLSTMPGMLTTTPPTTPGQVAQAIGRAIAPDTMALVMGYAILL